MFKSLFTQTTPKHPLPLIANMTAPELQEQLDAGEPVFLLDVRSAAEYQHDGHIPGARLLPLNYLNARLSELPKDRPIVCICRSGSRSQFACETLAAAGFENIYNLGGGMFSWRASGFPVQ